jgi:hypothetical protein
MDDVLRVDVLKPVQNLERNVLNDFLCKALVITCFQHVGETTSVHVLEEYPKPVLVVKAFVVLDDVFVVAHGHQGYLVFNGLRSLASLFRVGYPVGPDPGFEDELESHFVVVLFPNAQVDSPISSLPDFAQHVIILRGVFVLEQLVAFLDIFEVEIRRQSMRVSGISEVHSLVL